MADMIYEIHSFPSKQLPFIFHKKCSATVRPRFINWHENIEILLCTEGNGTVHCGNNDIPIGIGDVFVLNPDTPHTLSSPGKVRYQCLIVDNQFCIDNGIAVDQMQFTALIRSSQTAELFRKVADAFDISRNKEDFTTLHVRLSVLSLLQNLCLYHCGHRQQTVSSVSSHVKKALQFIRTNLTTPVTLDGIAKEVGISKYHLSRQFREQTGSSVIRTVNMMRCIYARQLLEKGMSVSQAARSSGFDNLSYFTRTFRDCIGCLPSELNK